LPVRASRCSIFDPRMQPVTLIGERQLSLIVKRLCYELIENHERFENTVLLGLQPRGVFFARCIKDELKRILPDSSIPYGQLDITFFRDDFRRREKPLAAGKTEIDFIIEEKNVVLIDDVLYTGRTIRAGLDAMLAFGRPADVELMVLIDRRFQRQLPIEARYVGLQVDSIDSQKVIVEWETDSPKGKVLLYSEGEND